MASGVIFRAGLLVEIGKSIAVGRAHRFYGDAFINDDASWIPANDTLVSSVIIPVGSIDIFIGFTAAAYGFARHARADTPTHQPIDDKIDDQDRSKAAFY